MTKQKVNEDKFLELLNQVLQEQDGYTPEMQFVPAPKGTQGKAMTGYDTSTPFAGNQAYVNTVKIVHELYEFDPNLP